MAAPVSYAENYVRPSSLDEVLALVSAGGARIVAGGTDVILHPSPEVRTLVDLSALDLDYIDGDGDHFRIGAMATLTAMLEHDGLAGLLDGFIAGMLRQVGSPLLRNIATIGGHLARGRLSDVIPVLLALDARVGFFDGAHRELDLAGYYGGDLHRTPMVVTEVVVPRPGGEAAASFLKFARTAYDLAALNCACLVRVEDGRVAHSRVVIGETPRLGRSVAAAEEALTARPLDGDTIEATARVASETVEVGDDLRASADYRRHLAYVLTKRCLTEISERLEAR